MKLLHHKIKVQKQIASGININLENSLPIPVTLSLSEQLNNTKLEYIFKYFYIFYN